MCISLTNVLGKKYEKERVGLYRDDGLACYENVNGPKTEKTINKEEFDLNIASEANLKIFIFLDIIVNLSTGKYQPFNKLDNDPVYIDVDYNQPSLKSSQGMSLPTKPIPITLDQQRVLLMIGYLSVTFLNMRRSKTQWICLSHGIRRNKH